MKGLWVLLAAAILVLVLALLANPLSSWSGEWGSSGTLSFTYSTGSDRVTSITFQLPIDFAGKLALVSADSGWQSSLSANHVTVSGSSLSQGQTVHVNYHLTRYLSPRQTTFTSIATTASGSTLSAQGPLVVQENIVLLIFTYFDLLPAEVAAFAVGIASSANFVNKLTQPAKGEIRMEDQCEHSVVVYRCFLDYVNPRDCAVTHKVFEHPFPWPDEHSWCFDCTWDKLKSAYASNVCYCLKGWFGWGGAADCDSKTSVKNSRESVRKEICLPKERHSAGDEKSPPAPPADYSPEQTPVDCKKEPGYPPTPGLNCLECPDA